ncbi:MAG: hypothetical protein ABFD91_12045 [Anaerohalosphaeraceae bacterium]
MNQITTQTISVIDPVGKAIDKTKQILFSPFDIGKWFALGFCAWLAFLGEGGGGNGGGGGGDGGGGSPHAPSVPEIRHFLEANMYWLLPVGLTILLVVVLITLVLLWLRCRGKFMFLNGVARNTDQIVVPWKNYANHGNSLFLFKLCVGLIYAACMIPLIIGWIVVIIPITQAEQLLVAAIGMICLLTSVTLLLGLTFTIITKLTEHFVVPVMYIHQLRCMEAWRMFWGLLKNNLWRFFVYLLFYLSLVIGFGALFITLGIVTCCCFCCITAIPYIGTVLLLPFFVFLRSYSALYLAQYGPQWDVFAVSVVAPQVVPTPPPYIEPTLSSEPIEPTPPTPPTPPSNPDPGFYDPNI